MSWAPELGIKELLGRSPGTRLGDGGLLFPFPVISPQEEYERTPWFTSEPPTCRHKSFKKIQRKTPWTQPEWSLTLSPATPPQETLWSLAPFSPWLWRTGNDYTTDLNFFFFFQTELGDAKKKKKSQGWKFFFLIRRQSDRKLLSNVDVDWVKTYLLVLWREKLKLRV